jgi:hypothetical protein
VRREKTGRKRGQSRFETMNRSTHLVVRTSSHLEVLSDGLVLRHGVRPVALDLKRGGGDAGRFDVLEDLCGRSRVSETSLSKTTTSLITMAPEKQCRKGGKGKKKGK